MCSAVCHMCHRGRVPGGECHEFNERQQSDQVDCYYTHAWRTTSGRAALATATATATTGTAAAATIASAAAPTLAAAAAVAASSVAAAAAAVATTTALTDPSAASLSTASCMSALRARLHRRYLQWNIDRLAH